MSLHYFIHTYNVAPVAFNLKYQIDDLYLGSSTDSVAY